MMKRILTYEVTLMVLELQVCKQEGFDGNRQSYDQGNNQSCFLTVMWIGDNSQYIKQRHLSKDVSGADDDGWVSSC